MNTDDFEQLRQLLALKRHEQPPPGYFNNFSREVMARIRAGESGTAEEGAPNWWQQLWAIFSAKPVFAGAFGAATCAMLTLGILNTELAVGTPPGLMPVASESQPSDSASAVTVADLDHPQYSGTNPVAPIKALFDRYQLQATPVSFTYRGGN